MNRSDYPGSRDDQDGAGFISRPPGDGPLGYLTVERDGWPAVRDAVLRRDGGCVANQYRVFGGDLATDECANKWGTPLEGLALDQLELDHVTRHGIRYHDETGMIAVCPWHHRLSRTWRIDSRFHRALCRGWLGKHYPAVWGHAPEEATR